MLQIRVNGGRLKISMSRYFLYTARVSYLHSHASPKAVAQAFGCCMIVGDVCCIHDRPCTRCLLLPKVVTVLPPNSELLCGQNDSRVILADLQSSLLLIEVAGQKYVSYRELSLATSPLIYRTKPGRIRNPSYGFAI